MTTMCSQVCRLGAFSKSTYFDGIFAGQPLLALLVPEDEEGPPELVEGEATDRRHLFVRI